MTEPDPLLVRRFLVSGDHPADQEPGTRWPANEYRTIRSHRRQPPAPVPPVAGGAATPPKVGNAVPSKRRRAAVLAGAVAVAGLAAGGYVEFGPQDVRARVPVPSGALPPIAATSPPAAAPQADGTAPAKRRATENTHARASRTTTSPAATAASAAVGAATAATTSAAPVEPLPATPAEAARLAAPPQAARVGTITAGNGLCLDLNGGVPVDDNHVQVFGCNNTVAQQWTLASDGTLQVAGKCAQVTGDNTVHIIGCDAREQAQWRASTDDALVNVAAGACLTGADTPSTPVSVTTCDATDAQQWTFPS
jgi:hypothetical protein